ncbi:MAG TPA: hypothetical protein VGL94_08475 [Ktedonobacteraceae bacterium]|jgi:hypothetical protein
MGSIPNKREATFGDGLNDYFNINTADGRLELLNGAYISFYADAYTTLTGQIVNGAPAPQVSSSAPAIASSGTVTTNVGVARLAPTAAVTAAVMGTGTRNGQECLVVNEAAPSFTVQMAVSGTSNVADGVSCIIPGGQQRLFVWDNALSLWFEQSNLVDGKLADIVSATAPAIASSGTIATAGIGTSQVTPAAAVTACVLAPGIYQGQECTVANVSTTGANTITMAASATSNIADGTNTVISGLTCAKFKYVGSLWYHMK